MIGPTCPDCGHVHAANDARAIDRFSGHPRYIAATAPTPPRRTRAEAVADECYWRREGKAAWEATVALKMRRGS